MDSERSLRCKTPPPKKKIQEIRESASGTEETVEKNGCPGQRNCLTSGTHHPRNLGHYIKIRSINNRNRGRRRNQDQNHRIIFNNILEEIVSI